MIFTALGINGPYASAGGAGSGYLVSSNDHGANILLDCGPGVLSQLQKHIDLDHLDAVVLSHLHYDHMSDMLALQYALAYRNRVLPVYCPSEPEPIYNMLKVPCFDLSRIETMRCKNLHFDFLPAIHPVAAYSILVDDGTKKMVYTGDTNVNPDLETFARDADLLVADGAFLLNDWSEQRPHMSAYHCAQLAEACAAKQLYITHIPPKVNTEALLAEAKGVFSGARLLKQGAILHV